MSEASVEVVDSFCYLGDVIRCEGGAEAAVRGRIACAWKSWRELASLLYPAWQQSTGVQSMWEIGAPVQGRDLGYDETA